VTAGPNGLPNLYSSSNSAHLFSLIYKDFSPSEDGDRSSKSVIESLYISTPFPVSVGMKPLVRRINQPPVQKRPNLVRHGEIATALVNNWISEHETSTQLKRPRTTRADHLRKACRGLTEGGRIGNVACTGPGWQCGGD